MAVDDTTGDVDTGCRPGGRRTTRIWTSTVTHRRDALVHIPCAHLDRRRDLRRRPFVHMMHSCDDDDDRFLSWESTHLRCLELDEPAYGVAAGQAAVLYEDDAVVGAGLISSAR